MTIKLHRIKKTSCLLFAVLFLAACAKQEETAKDTHSFRSTLDIHLEAIQNRDLEKLRPTVADDVTMISPDGDKVDSKKVFMNFHETWFQQADWEWEGTIVKSEYTDAMGYGLIQYTFTQKDSIGNIIFEDLEYLVLVFRNSDAGWQLVHNQNTRIQKNNNENE